MTSFFKPKHLKFCERTFHNIVFAHTKFGFNSSDEEERSERVFKIPVRIGLTLVLLCIVADFNCCKMTQNETALQATVDQCHTPNTAPLSPKPICHTT